MQPDGKQSQLPEWIINPRPEKTTLTWRISQATRRSRPWRAVAGLWWRFSARNRITQRYPHTTAALAWVLSFIAIMIMVTVVYTLYSRVT